MKNFLFTAILLLCVAMGSNAQINTLKFNKDGKFKIVQFTDLHIKWQDTRSDIAFTCIKIHWRLKNRIWWY